MYYSNREEGGMASESGGFIHLRVEMYGNSDLIIFIYPTSMY